MAGSGEDQLQNEILGLKDARKNSAQDLHWVFMKAGKRRQMLQ
jgi:hypothetical protein